MIYILSRGEQYYPSDGLGDTVKIFEAQDDDLAMDIAKEALPKRLPSYQWAVLERINGDPPEYTHSLVEAW